MYNIKSSRSPKLVVEVNERNLHFSKKEEWGEDQCKLVGTQL